MSFEPYSFVGGKKLCEPPKRKYVMPWCDACFVSCCMYTTYPCSNLTPRYALLSTQTSARRRDDFALIWPWNTFSASFSFLYLVSLSSPTSLLTQDTQKYMALLSPRLPPRAWLSGGICLPGSLFSMRLHYIKIDMGNFWIYENSITAIGQPASQAAQTAPFSMPLH